MKDFSPKELTIIPKKIKLIKISIIYATFFYKIHQTWPTELGIKKVRRENVSTSFDSNSSKSECGNKTRTK